MQRERLVFPERWICKYTHSPEIRTSTGWKHEKSSHGDQGRGYGFENADAPYSAELRSFGFSAVYSTPHDVS